MHVLESDTLIRLPSVTVLKASAGSGKTYRLTERYVQFLLSGRIARNGLRNILAVTFSNNASREMREKVLEWLKKLYFRDPQRTADIAALVDGGAERAARTAGTSIEEILARYSDFQVRTIDSFMSTVFRASALDFGFSPEFEIVMESGPLFDYAFNVFLRETQEGSRRASLLDAAIRMVLGLRTGDDSFSWDPVTPLLAEIKRIDGRIGALGAAPPLADPWPRLRALETRIGEGIERVGRLVDTSGLEARSRSRFLALRAGARVGRFADLMTRGTKSVPVKKPARSNPAAVGRYEEIARTWEEVGLLVDEYTGAWARAYYRPYMGLHAELLSTLETVKRRQGKVFIDDINRTLGDYLTAQIVPDIYFRLGERVFHFLVDEFQDTSPLQWRNLSPLVENSLSMGGSLFVVGDTKQAIYGFRQADYTIMRALEEASPFPSAGHVLGELHESRRSRPRVLEVASEVFLRGAAGSEKYREAARRSGLDSWAQTPLAGADPGYAEVEILGRDDEDPPERRKLQEILGELHGRGYRWGDIAILATRNDAIIRATAWLNEISVPFISFSNLDVRARAIAGEMLALLAFLDSPPDDLSFATFILGHIFGRTLVERIGWKDDTGLHAFLFGARSDRPLYKAFQQEFPELWAELFAGLFRSAGYLPLYDLVSEAYATFDVFTRVRSEEATLAKLLEMVKVFESSGSNSLREFLGQAGDEGGQWSIDVPRNADSVRAMTVHKAKGLGFPVVIVLLYGDAARGFEYTVLHEGGGTGLVKITRTVAERDPSLAELYDEEEMKEKVDRLNGLYVALTRARRELYVIGVKRDRDAFPFDLFPPSTFTPMDEKGPAVGDDTPAEPVARLMHHARPVPISFGRGRLDREERRRGELIHRMLELVEYAGPDLEADLAAAADRVARQAREESAGARAAAQALARIIRGTDLGRFFQAAPGRVVLREKEICDETGRLFRMDRIVVDPDRVTVIDFKTGEEQPQEHEEQVRGYMGILSALHPRLPVAGMMAYVDLGRMRSVG
jgi:ATP-dependent exoDNAse (exonuclease V) beta subunit